MGPFICISFAPSWIHFFTKQVSPHLPIVETLLFPIEFEGYIKCNFRIQENTDNTYIGLVKALADHASFTWVYNTTFEYGNRSFFQNWAPGQPSYSHSELCVLVAPTTGTWASTDCQETVWAMFESWCKFISLYRT